MSHSCETIEPEWRSHGTVRCSHLVKGPGYLGEGWGGLGVEGCSALPVKERPEDRCGSREGWSGKVAGAVPLSGTLSSLLCTGLSRTHSSEQQHESSKNVERTSDLTEGLERRAIRILMLTLSEPGSK